MLNVQTRPPRAVEAFVEATVAIAAAGTPLMRRIVPDDGGYRVWDHYPEDDAVDPEHGARWFYHAHAPKPGWPDEHGHFHLFLDRGHFDPDRCLAAPVEPGPDAPELVHLVSLSIDRQGLPVRLFTVNRWATDEWLYSASDILDRIDRFDLSDATGDPLVARWLTAAVRAYAPEVAWVVRARDRAFAAKSPEFFEDRSAEMLSRIEISLDRLG